MAFRPAVVLPDYFCGHPWPDTSDGAHGYSAGRYITPTTELIASEPVVRFLLDRCAVLEPRWPELRQPCGEENRIEVTQWGDTLRFPFWTDYLVLFPESLDAREFVAGLMRGDPGLFGDVGPTVKAYYQMRGMPATDLSGQ